MEITNISKYGCVVVGMQKVEGVSKSGKPYSMVSLTVLKNPDSMSEGFIGFSADSFAITSADFNEFLADCQIGNEYVFGFSRATAYVDSNGRAKTYQGLVSCIKVEKTVAKK